MNIQPFDPDTCDDIGIVALDDPAEDRNDRLFWQLVRNHAIENEYSSNLVIAAEKDPDRFLVPGKDYYDENAVEQWLRQELEPVVWRWWRWVPEPDSEDDNEELRFLDKAEEGDEGAFVGAVAAWPLPEVTK